MRQDFLESPLMKILTENPTSINSRKIYRVVQAIGILNLIKDSIPEDLYKSLYFTLFESHLSYGITIWGGVSNNKL